MITVREFHKILDELYSRGYVLVRLHDICYEVTDPESGRKKMVYGDIMLPKGKKALVISQDDLCYYEYQNGCGLAQRIIPGKDGGLACEYIDANGAIHTGNYDLVPILDDFIKNHPDFSYRGARAVLGFTGYNGILGYRTDESYSPSSPYYDPEMEDSPNDSIDADRARAVEILKMLAGEGYELASHSWGHRDMNTVSLDGFQRDTDRWERNVQELIRKAVGEPSDIYIFPFGSDIGAVGGYARDIINADGQHPDGYARFMCLQKQGFRYYCNVNDNVFVQKGEDYFRMGRIDIDGLKLWKGGMNPEKSCLSEFMDIFSVFDPVRLYCLDPAFRFHQSSE